MKKILPFEMKTQSLNIKKNVLLKEIERIKKVAIANRDAIELVDIARIENDYLK